MIFLLETTCAGSPSSNWPITFSPGNLKFEWERAMSQNWTALISGLQRDPPHAACYPPEIPRTSSLPSICFYCLHPTNLMNYPESGLFFIIISVAVGKARPQEKKINFLPNTCRPDMEPCFRNRDQLLVADC